MKTPSAHRRVLKRANELGYFPTPGQAKEISCASATEYGKRSGANPVDGVLWTECTDWAIKWVMENRLDEQFTRTLAGTGGDVFASQVAEVIKEAHGKQLRIIIEEM